MVFSTTAANACTSFLLKAQNGDVVYGRTLEFALALHSQLVVMPRGYLNKSMGPDGKTENGLAYNAKYGAAGMNGLGLPVVVDKAPIARDRNDPCSRRYVLGPQFSKPTALAAQDRYGEH